MDLSQGGHQKRGQTEYNIAEGGRRSVGTEHRLGWGQGRSRQMATGTGLLRAESEHRHGLVVQSAERVPEGQAQAQQGDGLQIGQIYSS